MSPYSHGTCAICKERHDFLMALHGEKGGPMCCLLCSGKWHAEHGKRRRLGRIVLRAMQAFLEAGGSRIDLTKLADTAGFQGLNAFGSFGIQEITDPLGYLAGVAATKDEVIELTSEVLDDTIKLAQLVVTPWRPHEQYPLARRTASSME
jgi:hypothetical protein